MDRTRAVESISIVTVTAGTAVASDVIETVGVFMTRVIIFNAFVHIWIRTADDELTKAAINAVLPLFCYIQVISERFRDKGLVIKRYIHLFTYVYLLILRTECHRNVPNLARGSQRQGLKYNFQGGELFSSPGPPVRSAPPPFISWVHVSIAGSQIINDRLNVLSMIFIFLQFCKIL